MVDVIHIGPTKTATTWLYEAVSEHPQIQTPVDDSLNYFDIKYHRGKKWYKSKWNKEDNYIKRMEFTPSYIWSKKALSRIKKDVKNPKLVVCVRNPIKRSFSHYWHDKKKKRYNYDFEECLDHYDLFQSWVEGSMYGMHLSKVTNLFDSRNIHIMNFYNLKHNTKRFLHGLYKFMNVDVNHIPTILHEKVNEARPIGGKYARSLAGFLKRKGIYDAVWRGYKNLEDYIGISPRMEKIGDVDENVIKELETIFSRDSLRVREMFGVDPLNLSDG